MFCEKCGSEIPKGASFCEKCGNPVEQEAGVDLRGGGESRRRWILGGIAGFIIIGIAIIIFVVRQFAAEPSSKPVQTAPVSATEPPEVTEQPKMTEPPEVTEQPQVTGPPEEQETPVIGNTPEEVYENYLRIFTEAVNTGVTEEMNQVMTGKVYKQQCKIAKNYYKRGIREEIVSYSIMSSEQVNAECTEVSAKETIKVYYADGTSKTVKQKYCYTCQYIDNRWVITAMRG